MSWESTSRAVQVNGGYTLSGVNRLYGVAVKAGPSVAASIIVRKTNTDGVVLGAAYAAANYADLKYTNKPISTDGATLFIEAVGNGSLGVVYVDDCTTVTAPYKNLVCRVTKA